MLGPSSRASSSATQSPLGEFVRIAGTRFRVIGVMEPKGQMLGFDLDDTVYVPVATAMQIFNLDELSEIDVTLRPPTRRRRSRREVRRVLAERHGEEDFTVTTQQAMLDVFGNVMGMVTLAVGAIAAISLLVGAIGILTMMWIAVGERTSEIGLLRAIGASRRAGALDLPGRGGRCSLVGGLAGLAGGLGRVRAPAASGARPAGRDAASSSCSRSA